MVGNETDGEKYDQNHDQFQTSLLQQWVDIGVLSQNHHDVSITAQNDDQRQDKPGDRPADAVWQVVSGQVGWGGVKTRVWFFFIILVKEYIRSNLNNDQNPDQSAYGQRVATGDFPHHFHRVHNAQVPIDAYAGKEADAAIKVEVEAEARHLAERLAKLPVTLTRVIVDEERQGKQIQQVRHPEIEHEDVDVSVFLPAHTYASQSTDIGHRPDNEHGDKDGRQKAVRKI